MKTTKTKTAALALILALTGITLAEPAFAWYRGGYYGPRVSVGFGFGFPAYGYGYGNPYYAPYSYYPPYYAAPVMQQQPVYIEHPAQQAQPQQPAGYWYYCNDSRAYYPYVKDCPSGWQRVSPQPE